MVYMKRCIIEYLSKLVFILLLTGCSSNILNTHLENLQEKNNQINLEGWEVVQKTETGLDISFFSLKKQIGDTTFSLSFSYLKKNGCYKLNDFIKSYNTDSSYNEMALSNSDTLYFFKIRAINDNPDNPFYTKDYKDMIFITGKYYYMYKRGELNWGQNEYFENHMDSLIKIKGNNLHELPDLRLKKNDTISLPEESLFPVL